LDFSCDLGYHHFNTVGWVIEGHTAHEKVVPFIPGSSLLEQVEENQRGQDDPGSSGKWLKKLRREVAVNDGVTITEGGIQGSAETTRSRSRRR